MKKLFLPFCLKQSSYRHLSGFRQSASSPKAQTITEEKKKSKVNFCVKIKNTKFENNLQKMSIVLPNPGQCHYAKTIVTTLKTRKADNRQYEPEFFLCFDKGTIIF